MINRYCELFENYVGEVIKKAISIMEQRDSIDYIWNIRNKANQESGWIKEYYLFRYNREMIKYGAGIALQAIFKKYRSFRMVCMVFSFRKAQKLAKIV